MSPRTEIPAFLADTWWFALTGRLDDAAFPRLVERRAGQGFTAAQLVVGIPPEVGPAHPAAQSNAPSSTTGRMRVPPIIGSARAARMPARVTRGAWRRA